MKITPFAFDESLVRAINRDGQPWFIAKDVCRALGLEDHKVAVRKLDDDEGCSIPLTDALGRLQDTLVISESGLYALVLRCRDAMSPGSVPHRFRKWVTSEVLPSIRQTGSYGVGGFDEARIARLAGEAAVAAVKSIVPALVEARLASRGVSVRRGKTSGQLWREFGFPPLKGAANWLGNRLVEMGCITDGNGELGVSTARMFDPDKARRWLDNGGRLIIDRYIVVRRGQGVLPFRAVN